MVIIILEKLLLGCEMKPYFLDIAHQEKLRGIVESWRGTPFRHRCGVKGLGTDCIHFVARVLEEMGILHWRPNMIPSYPRDWHLHNTRELLSESIRRELNVTDVSLANLINGDIILFHFGQAAAHAAIYLDNYLYQALTDMCVCKISFSDRTMRRQMKYAMRIME